MEESDIEDDNLDLVRGALNQVQGELEDLRKFLYKNDDSLICKVRNIETHVDMIAKTVNQINHNYMSLKAEDRKGQWALCVLLATTLLGWAAQYLAWLVN